MKKISRYLQEIKFSLLIGTDLPNKSRLALNTIQFHLANSINSWLPNSRMKSHTNTFHLQLGNNPINLQLRTHTGDIFVFYEVFLDGCYWLPKSWCTDVMNIVDLGAHIGLTTLFLSQYFPQARFVCVEPDAENLALLKYNLSILRKKAYIIEAAVGSESGEVSFDNTGSSWQGHITGYQPTGRKVRCYTMPEIIELVNLQTIDILKIDIEGAEEFLFGYQEEWLKRVKVILIELHPPYSFEKFEKDMAVHGFSVLPANSLYGNRVIAAVPTHILKMAEGVFHK